MVAPGNPWGIKVLDDLAQDGLQFINRNRGSGTRLWLDKKLQGMGLAWESIRGYNRETGTHTATAQAVKTRKADAGLGLEAAAKEAGLDFIPLFQERFDLVLPLERVQDRNVQVILDYLQSREFRRSLEELGGYESGHSGEELTP